MNSYCLDCFLKTNERCLFERNIIYVGVIGHDSQSILFSCNEFGQLGHGNTKDVK